MTQNTSQYKTYTYLLRSFNTSDPCKKRYGIYNTEFRLLATGYGSIEDGVRTVYWLAADLYPAPLHEFMFDSTGEQADYMDEFYTVADMNGIATIATQSNKKDYHTPLTPVAICNVVLRDILKRPEIERLGTGGGTPEQKACYESYNHCVSDVLARGCYEFATKRVTLKVDEHCCVTLPTDCEHTIRLVGDRSAPGKRAVHTYSQPMLTSLRRLMVQDSDSAELTYVSSQWSAEQFTPDFVCALVRKLAIVIANSLYMTDKHERLNKFFRTFEAPTNAVIV